MKKLLLIVYCHVRWQSNYCREFYHALAKELEGQGQVFCIDRPLALLPDIVRRPAELMMALWKTRTVRVSSNLTLYRPVILLHDQIALSMRVMSRLNRWLVRRQMLKRFGAFFADSGVFTYVVEPYQHDYVKIFDNEISVYDCIAEWASYPGLSDNEQEKKRLFENKTVNAVDIVFTVSQELHDRRKKMKEAVYYLPWAAEYGHFSRARGFCGCEDLLEHRAPYIGFIGNIWGIFDIGLVRHIAESLRDCSVILIGGLADRLPGGFREKFEEVCRMGNVHWLGYKDHDTLPDYIHHFDVCVMTYVIGDWTRTCCPAKFYQYLAQGKPVVSVDIPEVSKYDDEDIVKIADGSADFVRKILLSFKEGRAEELMLKRRKVAAENSWQRRASCMLEILRNTDHRNDGERP